MRILLDECIDRRLSRDLVGYEVRTQDLRAQKSTIDLSIDRSPPIP
jgi:predicted nuclease of predicted toxin-antitoxin system